MFWQERSHSSARLGWPGEGRVGTLSYTDPKHPHAVIQAGSDGFGYDPVGNQTARPGGVTVSYTPFDLPRAITKGAQQVAAFSYDGDEKRIHKITASEETIYFEDLYERVTHPSSPSTPAVHRFYVRSPERVVAIVGRGGVQTGTLYVHVDHLGSTDVLTDDNGGVIGRNPTWGDPSPPPAPKTTVGFTGHESDADLGLVNMRERIFDPKVGRFLTTDPIVSRPLSGQSWNAYSYVAGNPLSLVDRSGFASRCQRASVPERARRASTPIAARNARSWLATTSPPGHARSAAIIALRPTRSRL
jgi:RHS repeat-associated protein